MGPEESVEQGLVGMDTKVSGDSAHASNPRRARHPRRTPSVHRPVAEPPVLLNPNGDAAVHVAVIGR